MMYVVIVIWHSGTFEIRPYFHGTASDCIEFSRLLVFDENRQNERRMINGSTEGFLRLIIFDMIRKMSNFSGLFNGLLTVPISDLRTAFLTAANAQLVPAKFEEFLAEFTWIDSIMRYWQNERIEDMTAASYSDAKAVVYGPYCTQMPEADRKAICALVDANENHYLVAVSFDDESTLIASPCYAGKREKCEHLAWLLNTASPDVWIVGKTTSEITWKIIRDVIAVKSRFGSIISKVLSKAGEPLGDYNLFLRRLRKDLILATKDNDQFIREFDWFDEIVCYYRDGYFKDVSPNEYVYLPKLIELDEYSAMSPSVKEAIRTLVQE